MEIPPVASLDMILYKKRITKAWSVFLDAQAGLRLCCSHTPEDRFSRIEAHIRTVYFKISKGAKSRKGYNQAPHLDTNGKPLSRQWNLYLKMLIAYYVFYIWYLIIYNFKCTQDYFCHGSKEYDCKSDCSKGSSLIWNHIVCNIGYQSISVD